MAASPASRPATPVPETVRRPVLQLVLGGLIIPLLVLALVAFVVLRVLLGASADQTVPRDDLMLVRTAPEETAPLAARFGGGRAFRIIGATPDMRWLKVELWDGQFGWALRPLDLLPWSVRIAESAATVAAPGVTEQPAEPQQVAVAGGVFIMGSAQGAGDADEYPPRPVTLSPFRIDRTEVTVADYWRCVAAGACAPPDSDASRANPHYLASTAFDAHPMINVSWDQAAAYCAWRGMRLPTEAEWEMAAGWNTKTAAKVQWPWGNESAANVNLARPSGAGPARVGSNTGDVSPSGVLDMGGNVREWVLDHYKVNYYAAGENTDPRGPTFRRGEGEGWVVRGGAYADGAEVARVANRSSESVPQPYIGFRCAQRQ